MNDNSPSGKRAFNRIELLVLVATAAALIGLLSFLGRVKNKPTRIMCLNNLKQLGLDFRIWSGDHHDRFPMAFYPNGPDTLKIQDGSNVFRYFQVMSNELDDLNNLTCPTDNRVPAASLSQLADTNISYFIGLDADEIRPKMFLAGDRNFTINGAQVRAGETVLKLGDKFGWTRKMHRNLGNVALCDGSVQEITTAALTAASTHSMTNSGANLTRLLFP